MPGVGELLGAGVRHSESYNIPAPSYISTARGAVRLSFGGCGERSHPASAFAFHPNPMRYRLAENVCPGG